MDTKLIKSLSLLDKIDYSKVVRAAQSALSDPLDEEVLNIAICGEDDVDCIDRGLSRLFEKTSVDSMSTLEALNYYAQFICLKILDGSLSPEAGSECLSRMAIKNAPDGYTKLDPFIYASSELESRPEDRKFFQGEIVAQAKKVIDSV